MTRDKTKLEDTEVTLPSGLKTKFRLSAERAARAKGDGEKEDKPARTKERRPAARSEDVETK